MKSFEFHSESEQATFAFGKKLGESIEGPMLVFLNGTLGAGKTRFVQAVAAGLDIDPQTVTSPTFTLMIPYTGRLQLVHVDAYRINDADEAEQLGLDDWLESGCVMMVEWAERIASVLANPDLEITIEHTGENERRFKFEAFSVEGAIILEKM